MYLSDIEIVGFKSFAQKTKLKFTSGLSAVVGPNGCGKTNVVDAIRWVLGEKKASTLRSDVMENVIFNGTRDRKPLSLAEVSITFDNTKNLLPTEYNEIVVTRRLYRNGDSEYLLNKTQCRLKDILDLFMDTGIGSDSYSVIELKMVDAILSGKVDDRRAMFEEAAGIKKYKARRKESLKKLESVKADMERIQDILQEVRKNVNSLSRQAAKTKRYNQYLTELKTLEIELFAREYAHFNSNLKNLSVKLAELSAKKISLEISLGESEKDISLQKENLASIESELSTAIDKEKNLLNIISDFKQSIAVTNEKILSFDSSRNRITSEIAESEQNLKASQEYLKEIQAGIETAKSRLSESSNNVKLLADERDAAGKKVRDAESIVSAANTEIISLKNRIDSLNNIINRSKEKKAGIARKIQQFAEDKFRYGKQIEELEADKRQNDKLLPELQNELGFAEKELKLATEKKLAFESGIEQIKLQINDKKNVLGGKKASLDFLNSLVDTGEAAKFLSDSKNWQTKSDKVLLGEVIGTDDEYRIAVLTALGESAHSYITDSRESALNAITALRNNGKGKSGFICLDSIPNVSAPANLPSGNGVKGWLSEIVRVDDNIRSLLRGLLGKTLLVENEQTAIKILSEGSADICVTLDGQLWHSAGFVSGGSVSQKEGQWVGKKERITKLNNEITKLKSEIDELQNKQNDISLELALIDIANFQKEIKSAESAVTENRKKAGQFELKLESLINNMNFIDDNSARLQEELSELTSDDSISVQEIEQITLSLNEKQSAVLILREELLLQQNQLSGKQDILRNAELNAVEIESSYKSLENDKSRINGDINQIVLKIESRKKEIDSFDLQKEELAVKIDNLTEKLAISEAELESTKSKRDILTSLKKEAQDRFEQQTNEFNILRRDYDKLKESIHQLELQETEANSHIQNITDRLTEQYDADIRSLTIEDNPEFDISTAKSEILSLRDKLSQIGNVNFMALEEYEIQNERLEFYDKQMSDLTESQKFLKETIDEINATAERNFRETFDKIQINFRNLFVKLFGPDAEADIHLESDDLLESDIVITAKPPNKRPHSIEMLSGGEKTLTAIALLFAIYLVKPSPFCILDEVDAPLDDANIDKFVNLIKEFSIDTQFLIVTHNKKTMEAADTLYGVTMQEDGVSKVVAVKLNNEAA
ncbi:MAG: chromosome segregation protein SMC [Candidatus Kapabacteria bacterium]|nr:chromosome segregation protein SMC [Candidatus Kapabacteria bacterium]